MLTDPHQRKISYLRLSITDVCNFKCQYCLPDGYHCDDKPKFLSVNEIRRVTTAFAEMGVWKVRLSGGEPSVRGDFTEITKTVNQIGGIDQIAVTTNGLKLKSKAKEWRDAGISKLNISVDSLDPKIFHEITGIDRLAHIMDGINEALKYDFEQIKINVVLHKGINDQDFVSFLEWAKHSAVCISFIELMRTGDNVDYFNKYHVSADNLRAHLIENKWQAKERCPSAGPAIIFDHPDYKGNIGIIAAYSIDFCEGCNRLRVSATGDLHLCLFGNKGFPLRHLLQDDSQKEELKETIRFHLGFKEASHFLHENNSGNTPHLASIGG